MNATRVLTWIGIASGILTGLMAVTHLGLSSAILIPEMLCILSLTAASTVHYYPRLRQFISSKAATYLFVVYHAVILLLSAAYAKAAVNTALGMPASDYVSTVSICAMLYYVPVGIIGVALLAMAAGAFCLILVAVTAVTQHVSSLLRIAADIFRRGDSLEEYERQATRFAGRRMRDSVALCTYGAVALFMSNCVLQYVISKPAFIRGIAYNFDYQQLTHYPGIDPKSRVVIHNSNIYTVATPTDTDITITPKDMPRQSVR